MASATQAQVKVDVDLNNLGINVSPTLYGIFFEDINHAADGGLYAELIHNRSFEDEGIRYWHNHGNGELKLTTDKLLNEKQGHAAKLTIKTDDELGKNGVVNEGFWGINTQVGQQYKLNFWARADKAYKGTLRAELQSKKGESLGHIDIPVKLSKQWQKISANIIATGTDEAAQFALTANTAGSIYLDVVSLFPPTFKNRENGCRIDLAEKLAAMKPRFMRFPGGCFVEGEDAPENAFRWERTVGPIEQRPGHYGANWRYWTTDGMGFHEFLQLSEDLGAKPLYVVNVGLWHHVVNPVESSYTPLEELDMWINECMDALEYANGPVTSKYGKMRADNGHPEPFNIEYLEIGNENANFNFNDNSDQSMDYFKRYRRFYDAIKAKYPNMHCIGNVEAWGTDYPSWRSQEPVDMLDEHYYRNPKWFANNYNKYDNYDRKGPQIYVGEYAVTSQFGKVGNLNAAIGEAIYMLGMENNSDIVAMNSYAPIFVNENFRNWPTDMIHFNSGTSIGTPSYWVQQMFPNHIGTRMVNNKLEWNLPEAEAPAINRPTHIGFATWNSQASFKQPELIIDGETIALPDFKQWTAKNEGRVRGGWKVEGDVANQTGRGEGTMFVCPLEISAKKYTYRVKARKNGGYEGFLLLFNAQNERDYDWCNIGGWGNTVNNIEQGNDGGRIQLTDGTRFVAETGRWYDVEVRVDGDKIECYIDGKLNMEATRQNPTMRGVYANASINEATGELYIKVINCGQGKTTGTINLANGTAKSAELIRLNSESGNDENDIRHPFNIVPRSGNVNVEGNGSRLTFDVLPYSINIITAKTK